MSALMGTSAWDAIAPGYDQFVTSRGMELGGDGLRHAGLSMGMRFLDVAAGTGALSIPAGSRRATPLPRRLYWFESNASNQ